MHLLLKIVLAVALMFATLVVGIVGALLIDEYFLASQVFLVNLIISIISFVLIASLTVWRVVSMPRFATVTLIASVPIMVTLMGSLIYYWTPVSAVLFRTFPWTETLLWWVGPLIEFFEMLIRNR